MVVSYKVTLTQGNINRLVKELSAVDKKLRPRLLSAIKKQATRTMQKQKAVLAGLPVTHVSGTTGLRRKITLGLRGSLGKAARLRIETRVPSNSLGFAPRGLDTEFSGWRAPLFGDKKHWFHHSLSGPSWFIGPAEQSQGPIRQNIAKLLQDAANQIAASNN